MSNRVVTNRVVTNRVVLLDQFMTEMMKDAYIDSDIYYTKREIYNHFISLLFKQTGLQETDTLSSISTISTISTIIPKAMNYADVETMAFHLSLQLHYLEKQGFSLFFWQPSDISVIRIMHKHTEQTLYLLANLSQLVPLYKEDLSQLSLVYPSVFPFPPERCAPELFNMKVLPFITHRSASYYSLGLLCLWCLNISYENLSLEKLQGTKLFYFLERCLKKVPAERVLLYL